LPKPRHLAAAMIAALAAGPASAQTLYKCVLEGKTVYQSEPCAGKAAQSEIRAPASAAPPAAAPAEPSKPPPDKAKPGSRINPQDMQVIVDTFVGYTLCSEADPGFGAKLSAGFDGWKERHAEVIGRFNQDPEGPKMLDARLQQERQRLQSDPAAARGARIEMCARTAVRVAPQPPQ
jgi:hypothetical protein